MLSCCEDMGRQTANTRIRILHAIADSISDPSDTDWNTNVMHWRNVRSLVFRWNSKYIFTYFYYCIRNIIEPSTNIKKDSPYSNFASLNDLEYKMHVPYRPRFGLVGRFTFWTRAAGVRYLARIFCLPLISFCLLFIIWPTHNHILYFKIMYAISNNEVL
jgi:hypothetical protein